MTTEQPVPDQPEDAKQTSGELRAYADRMKAENAAMRTQLLGTHLEAINLKPDTGLGKAITKDYSGEITAEAVARYAQDEYGHAIEESTPEPTAAVIQADAQDKVDGLVAGSTPVTPTTQLERIAQHDTILSQPEATRADAQAALSDKLSEYLAGRPQT
jgi:hypothetical protein